MRKFEFELESVLRLRRFAEAQARQALAEAIARRNEAEEALAATRARIAREMDRLRSEILEMDTAIIAAAWREVDRLEVIELKQMGLLAECEREVERRQADYLAAQRDRKSLDRLREQRQREHYAQIEWVEQVENDERAVISHSRKGSDP